MSFFSANPRSGEISYLRAEPSDLDEVARLIASLNSTPSSESLHCPRGSFTTVRSLLRTSDDFPGGWNQWFYKGVRPDGRIVAVLGCQPDPPLHRGWLWGPWYAAGFPARENCHALLEAYASGKPRTMTDVEAFLNVENQAVLNALKSEGFSLGTATHLYTSPAPMAPALPPLSPLPSASEVHSDGKGSFPFLRTAHEVAFFNLHAEAFPAAPQTGQELLDARDDTRIIFAAADGLRLLGYVCVSINRTPLEGFIDYLAVKPSARGRGVGRWLLALAQRWIFEAQRLPQASLCVTNWRADARRLYESSGFRLQATGIAARLRYR